MTQVTFTEKEVQGVAEFVNFVYQKASWNLSTKENQLLSKYLSVMAQHIKKMDDHILELKSVVPATPKAEKKSGTKK